MNRNIQRLLIGLWILVFCLLIRVITRYCLESRETAVQDNKRNQLVIMAVGEEDESGKCLKELVDGYSRIQGNPEVKIRYVSQSVFKSSFALTRIRIPFRI